MASILHSFQGRRGYKWVWMVVQGARPGKAVNEKAGEELND